MAGCTACGTQRWYRSEGRLYRSCRDSTQHETGRSFVAEMDDFGAKLGGFRGWKEGKLGGMLNPLETKQIHESKSTKHHQTNKSQKKIGAIFGGDFRI